MKKVVYIELAATCMLIAIALWILQRVPSPVDNVIVRLPDTTLHDLLYFELMHMVNLFGSLAVLNLCYFIESSIGSTLIIRKFIYLSYIMTIVVFSRCIFNIISYSDFSSVEMGLDILLIAILFTHNKIKPWFFWIFRHRQEKKIQHG